MHWRLKRLIRLNEIELETYFISFEAFSNQETTLSRYSVPYRDANFLVSNCDKSLRHISLCSMYSFVTEILHLIVIHSYHSSYEDGINGSSFRLLLVLEHNSHQLFSSVRVFL